MSKTLQMIMKRWVKDLPGHQIISLPFEIEHFCAENDELLKERDTLREALESIAYNDQKRADTIEYWLNKDLGCLIDVITNDIQTARCALQKKNIT